MTIKLDLFWYDEIHDAIVEVAKTFIDPKTIPDPEEEDAPPATLLYDNFVLKALPEKVSLYGGIMGLATLDGVTSIKSEEVGEDLVATIPGTFNTWIQGKSEEAEKKCKYYCDLNAAYFRNKYLLNISGCRISVPENNPHRFARISAADKGQTPKLYTAGSTSFVVTKLIERNAYTL